MTGLPTWHLSYSLVPAESLWVYSLKMEIGMYLLLSSQLLLIITFSLSRGNTTNASFEANLSKFRDVSQQTSHGPHCAALVCFAQT